MIEVNTEFGKLSVPVQAIRRIDFGLHLPDGADKKIASAIKRLTSAQFKERRRDFLRVSLVALGAFAYPSLMQAAKSSDAETSKRAQDALAKIKAKVPAKELHLSADDKIVTARFTIVGRILTPTIKAKSEYFGDAEHALAKLRHLRLLADSRDLEVVVDAGNVEHARPDQWFDDGNAAIDSYQRTCRSRQQRRSRTTPHVARDLHLSGPRGYTRTAAGLGKKKGGRDVARSSPGTLLGRIGVNGETFIIGDRYEGVPEREGKLYLQIVPSPYEAASVGSYQVKIMVRD